MATLKAYRPNSTNEGTLKNNESTNGRVNIPTEYLMYTSEETDTAKVVIDNSRKTIRVDVKKSPKDDETKKLLENEIAAREAADDALAEEIAEAADEAEKARNELREELEGYADKEVGKLEGKVDNIKAEIDAELAKKADSEAVYEKAETYSKEEANEAIEKAVSDEKARAEAAEKALDEKIDSIEKLTVKPVDELPEVGIENVMYLLKKEDKDDRDEYLWVDGK